MKTTILVCPHCGNKTPHQEVFRHSYVADWYSSDGTVTEDPPTSYYIGYACSTCEDLSIYGSHDFAEDGEESLQFPADVVLDKSIPEVVATNYRESKRVQKVSPNAFAVLTDQKVTVPMTWQMDKFFRTLVEYVYVAPARLEEFKKSVAKDKKEEDEEEA